MEREEDLRNWPETIIINKNFYDIFIPEMV
jgi:hypothetical protein